MRCVYSFAFPKTRLLFNLIGRMQIVRASLVVKLSNMVCGDSSVLHAEYSCPLRFFLVLTLIDFAYVGFKNELN